MPAPYDVIYMLLDIQSYGGKRMLNRYFFGADIETESNAQDLVDEFIATQLPFIVAAQVDTLTHTEIRAVNVSNILDYASVALVEPGVNNLDGLPPAAPVGFIAAQPGYGLRPAKKRISGVPEAWQIDGLVDTTVASLTLLATQLGTALEGDDGIYYPVTVTLPTPFIPPLPVVPVNRDALSWTIRPYMSTQTTRRQRLT